MAAPNLANLTTITGKLQPYAVTTSLAATGVECDADKLVRVNTILASNVLGSAAAKISVTIYRDSTHTYIVKNVSIPLEASVVILGKADGGLNLEEGDEIYAQASAATAIELLISYDEIA